jgi:Patatin-like phospholipase
MSLENFVSGNICVFFITVGGCMAPFRIGINMAGAISAGAYTAGVLDFLIQALDEWHEAKARGDLVPMHDVSIEVMAGASAGGMCAAIGSVALQEQFPSVTTLNPSGDQSANKLYSSWVDRIDISSLLQTEDLNQGGPVISVLDSTVLPSIASFALTPGPRRARKYVSPTLTLFLTLTNLRGMVYDIDPANGGSFEEQISFYADALQFQTVLRAGDKPTGALAKPLPLDSATSGSSDWQLLQQAALATGAFPLMLAPRVLARDPKDYTDKIWVVNNPDPKCVASDPQNDQSEKICQCQLETRILPDFGKSMPASPITTVNVDGGATNNNPFELTRRYLASLDPKPKSGHNNRDPLTADRAVLTIAPFPGVASFDPNYDATRAQGLFAALGKLVDALISQSRFLGQGINLFKENETFSRFLIAPSDDKASDGQPALMSSSLGAFGGFLAKQFRDRDYQLGRRNCQRFLQQYFVLQAENPVIEAGLRADRASLVQKFKAGNDPGFRRPDPTKDYMPIIPLCGAAAPPIGNPGRQPIPKSMVENTSKNAADRVIAVLKALTRDSSFLLRTGAGILEFFFKGKLRNAIQDYLIKNLDTAVESD